MDDRKADDQIYRLTLTLYLQLDERKNKAYGKVINNQLLTIERNLVIYWLCRKNK